MRLLPAVLCILVASPLAPGMPGLAAQAPEVEGDTLPVPWYEVSPLVVEIFPAPTRVETAPYAVSVHEVQRRAGTDTGLALDETLRRIPGVQVDNRFNYALGERISVRGFGARAQFGVRGLRALVDGIPATFPDGQSALDVVDPKQVRTVEVVRGPASAFHGNAAGGVIVLRTVSPPATGHHQSVTASAGSAGTRRLEGQLGGRTGGVGYQVAGSHLGFDGYRPHNESRMARGSARVDLGRGFRISAHASDFAADNPGSLSEAQLAEDRFQAFAGNVNQGTGKTGRQGQVGATWTTGIGAATLDATLYGITRDIVNPIPGVIVDLGRSAGGARAHLRGAEGLLGRGGSWVIGVEAAGQWDDRLNFANVGGERGDLTLDQAERVGAFSPFGSMSAALGPFLASASVRYDRFDFRASDRFGTGAEDRSGGRVMSAVSPAVGVSVEVAPRSYLFGNVSTSFETPTTTELANRPDGERGFNPELEPQTTRSVEAGGRTGFAGDGMLEVTAYRAEVENSLVPFQTDGGRDFFRNAGAARHQGIEVAGRISPLPLLTAGAAFTLTDARFRAYRVGGEELAGRRVPGVARQRIDAFVDLRRGGHELGIEARARSSVPVDDRNEHEAPGHLLFDLRLQPQALAVGGAAVQPFLSVTNLFGTDHVTSVVPNAFGQRFFEPGPGRMLFLGASVRTGS